MSSYYLTLVLKPGIEEKAQQQLLSDIKKKILGSDGKLEKEDLWGEKALAYPIKKQTKGFYAHFEFSTDSQTVKGIDKSLKVEEDILRYLLVRQ